MSGQISATRTNIESVLRPLQQKASARSLDAKSTSRDVFADDIYLSNKKIDNAHANLESRTEACNEQEGGRRRFFRRRHSFGLFRWREARAFFRRMLFEPQKMINE